MSPDEIQALILPLVIVAAALITAFQQVGKSARRHRAQSQREARAATALQDAADTYIYALRREIARKGGKLPEMSQLLRDHLEGDGDDDEDT